MPGKTTEILGSVANRENVYVVAGLTERLLQRVHNCSVLIGRGGEVIGKHRKINELDIGLQTYARGHWLQAIPTEFGPVGIPICADNFPSTTYIGRSLGLMGCRLLLSPCAWAVEADHDNDRDPYGELWRESYAELARHGLTVVGVSNVGPITGGPWAGRKCIGCSVAVGPEGVLAQGPYDQEALVVFEV